MNLGINYSDFFTSEKTPETFLGDVSLRKKFSLLSGQIHPTDTVAIYGSSFSGYLAYTFLEAQFPGQVSCIFDREKPLKELRHIDHVNLDTTNVPLHFDHVIVAASPRHYDTIRATLETSCTTKNIFWLFAENSEPPLFPFMDFSGGTVKLPITYRRGQKTWDDVAILPKKQLAIILIHIWGAGEEQCAYCERMKPLLAKAREHDLIIIHATAFETDINGKFIHAEKSFDDSKKNDRSRQWPPKSSDKTSIILENSDPTEHQITSTILPVGIHSCATPKQRTNEYVEDDLEIVQRIFEEKKILYVLFAGGGSLQCLPFTTIGWVNIMNAGYHPIAMRDIIGPQTDFTVNGNIINGHDAGLLCFEINCRYSTDTKDVIEALENS